MRITVSMGIFQPTAAVAARFYREGWEYILKEHGGRQGMQPDSVMSFSNGYLFGFVSVLFPTQPHPPDLVS